MRSCGVPFALAGTLLMAIAAAAAPINPLTIGQTYTYQFAVNEEPVGTLEAACAEAAGAAMSIVSKMEIGNAEARHTLDSTLKVGDDLRPLRYSVKGKLRHTDYEYTCEYDHQGSTVQLKGAKQGIPISTTVQLPDGWETFDNNQLAGWSLLAARVGVEPGAVKTVQCFHPATGQILQCTLDFGAEEKLTTGGQTYDTVRCEVAEIKNTLWFAKDGLLIKGSQGPLTYTLMP